MKKKKVLPPLRGQFCFWSVKSPMKERVKEDELICIFFAYVDVPKYQRQIRYIILILTVSV